MRNTSKRTENDYPEELSSGPSYIPVREVPQNGSEGGAYILAGETGPEESQNIASGPGTDWLAGPVDRRSSYTEESVAGQTGDRREVLVPIMSLRELKQQLIDLERTHGISSEVFYRRWQAGEAPEIPDALRWALLYELLQEGYLM